MVYGASINDLGQVVGPSLSGGNLWDTITGVIQSTPITPRTINNSGQVAGLYQWPSSTEQSPAIWDST